MIIINEAWKITLDKYSIHRYKQLAAFCGDKRIVLQIQELPQFAHQFPYRSGLPEAFLPLHSSALLSLCNPPFH